MTKHNSNTLTEGQELLLSRFYDGEASLLDRLRARRLISKIPEAATFLSSLKQSTLDTQQHLNQSLEGDCDLWSCISARIDAEERAALYLGARPTTASTEPEGFMSRLLSSHALMGGLSGAAVAAALLLTLSPGSTQRDIPVISLDSASLSRAPQTFQGVTLPSGSSAAPSNGSRLSTVARSPLEVDWLRGAGPLKIIQNPDSSSGVIWVKRQRLSSTTKTPTPFSRGARVIRRGVDGKVAPRSE
jgi:hypothetical protein